MSDFSLTRQDTLVMKGIAICAMLCHHLYVFPPETVDPYTGAIRWIGELGKVCVAMFLFCSGYGLTAQYKSVNIWNDVKFIFRRLVKFYANYWVIFAIFVPISIFVFHRSLSDAYGEDSNILFALLQDILGVACGQSYNITWWFNQLIIILYLLFPLMYRVVHIKPWVGMLLSIALVRTCFYMPTDMLEMIAKWQLPFVLGMVWKLYEDKLPTLELWFQEHKYLFAGMSIVILIVTIICSKYPILHFWSGIHMYGFLTCAIALCLISILRHLYYTIRVLSFLGKHSTNIYLTHTFFNGYWYPEWLHTGEWLRGGGNFILLMTICLLISIGIEFLKEKIRLYDFVNFITKRI